ncbi:MAG: phosphoribosylamine--glycine ligase [Erysipelotrichaceae bacterium]
MKILVIGSGGREHAIVLALSKSPLATHLYCAPGNAGIAELATLVNLDINNNQLIVDYCLNNNIDLVIVGPEQVLLNGLIDDLAKYNIKAFGPNKKAAIIEGSKEFAKELMIKYHIPTAKYQVFSDFIKAKEYLDNCDLPIVIKYDGLAFGKGVVVASTYSEALKALEDMLLNKVFGDNSVIIEEYLEGEEFSLMAFVNKEKVYPLVISQDHKRAFDNDQGPNTGGMGAYSDVSFISDEIINQAINEVMIPTAKAMVSENRDFVGLLYGGLIITKQGAKVIEFNARFGDPETEVVLPRLKSDFLQVILDLLNDQEINLQWHNFKTVGVVLASVGYPGNYHKEIPLNLAGLSDIYHMGTLIKDNYIVSNGGRVLLVLGKGDTLKAAQEAAYQKVKKIANDKLFYRRDIANKAILK